ncbi:aminotransferase, AHBA_syn family [Citrifermentans bemidjiense Bem]|uniref:Aminotransferase, AHBA_syn family n=1 Tax=Citrifermentans bemidjiense (strain ATCC BAA-1014 / DSM 16622 / JCM 12645 / Bem) TaxID=404380 RepID=B5EAG4_CITBB|nr:DegT/DnrJ/EryC1/StrS family aminotransferase [Citrifermentans bemidjiense]ACH40303.1 aminotransferase, AHBA_syn family [Citrifermentans bemidjiense Bem]
MSSAEPVRYWDYLAAYEPRRDEYLRAVDRVFSSGRLVMGQEVAAFEEAIAAYCGTGYAVGVNSGTDALTLALKALGVGAGHEVITVSNTAVPTVAAIRAAGATPVFVDVEEDTFLIDVSQVEGAMNGRTRCILPVHLCGQMADMAPLVEIAKRRGVRIVEDCAQACGASYRGNRAGSLGDIGAFSFYPTKVLGAFGDAGVMTTADPELAARLRRLRFYGMEGSYYAEEEGFNSRLDEVQAALLSLALPGVERAVEKRRELAELYDQGLAGVGDLALPAVREGCRHQFYLYTVRTGRRDELQEYLRGEGIETRINYPHPVHLMRGYAFLGYREGDLPVTERLARSILSLPMYPELPRRHAEKVVEAVRAFFRGSR